MATLQSGVLSFHWTALPSKHLHGVASLTKNTKQRNKQHWPQPDHPPARRSLSGTQPITTQPTMAIPEFPDHVAGNPYVLTREQFLRFAGLLEDFQAFLKLLQQQAAGGRLPGNGHNYEPIQQAFWATIASFEAMRTFQPESDCCDSLLKMEAVSNAFGFFPMEWMYKSTSGTTFTVTEMRGCDTFVKEDSVLPEPVFTVTIPAYRDQPGRSHYEALRRGGTYRDF